MANGDLMRILENIKKWKAQNMKIFDYDIKYIQNRLAGMSDGKYPRWSLRDLAIVSRLVIIVNEHASAHVISTDEKGGSDATGNTGTY